MRDDKRLLPGAFYWVIPEVDPGVEDRDLCEPGHEWQDEIQPARFNGWNAAAEMLWNLLGFDGSLSWPVLWIGEAIELPADRGAEVSGAAHVKTPAGAGAEGGINSGLCGRSRRR